ncbi:MAG: hypothetical protein WD278_01830, partial [Pirellulales bacterium]
KQVSWKSDTAPGAFLSFSGDGQRLLMSPAGGPVIRVWDLKRGAPLRDLTEVRSHVYATAFARGASLFACADSDGIKLYNADTFRFSRELTMPQDQSPARIGKLAISADGTTLAAVGTDVYLWTEKRGLQRLSSNKPPRRLPQIGEVGHVALNADGTLLYTMVQVDRYGRGGEQWWLRVVDLSTDRLRASVGPFFAGRSARGALSPDKSRFAITFNGKVLLFDMAELTDPQVPVAAAE